MDSASSDVRPPHRAVVALGANLGDRLSQLRFTVERLAALSVEPILVSSVWETAPVNCPPGSPNFANAVVLLTPGSLANPSEWLGQFQIWEREAGRTPRQQINEARPLDVDLIAWGELRLTTPLLTIPHPRAHLRRFVLEPLAELAPDWVLAGQDQTVSQLLAGLPPEPFFRRWLTSRQLLGNQ